MLFQGPDCMSLPDLACVGLSKESSHRFYLARSACVYGSSVQRLLPEWTSCRPGHINGVSGNNPNLVKIRWNFRFHCAEVDSGVTN